MKIAVIGIGTIGSQVIRHLAKEPGHEVHGFEMAYPGHPNAAAGGESRLFRSFEFGSPEYQQAVVERAPGAWHDLEGETNRSLVTRTGALIFGDEGSRSLRELLENAKLPEETLKHIPRHILKQTHRFVSLRDSTVTKVH